MTNLRALEDAWLTETTELSEKATRLMAIAMQLEAATLRDAADYAIDLDERAATHERAHTLEQLTEHILGRRIKLTVEERNEQ